MVRPTRATSRIAREKFVHFVTERRGSTSTEGVEEADLTDDTREFLAKGVTQFIERPIKMGLKDVDDFDESKGATLWKRDQG
jgi:hypothetical protein